MTESTATTRTSRPPLLRAMVPALAAAIALASWWWAPSGDAALMTDRALLGLIEDSDLYTVDVDPAPTVWEHYTIAQGDSLANLWTNQWQLPEAALYTLLNDPKSADILRQVSPGQHLEWRADGEGSLQALRLWTDPSKGWEWNLQNGQLHRSALTYERNLHQVAVRGEIRTSLSAALAEMHRVLKPGGRLLVLEFSKPRLGPLESAYDFYSFQVLPRLGRLVADDADSYRYLAESIRVHPDQDALKAMMVRQGFERCEYYNLSGGIVALHIGFRL